MPVRRTRPVRFAHTEALMSSSLEKRHAMFAASRRPTAISVVLEHSTGGDAHMVPLVVRRMADVEGWADMEDAVRTALGIFTPPSDFFLPRNDKKRLFDPSALKYWDGRVPMTVDEENERVTITASPDVSVEVFREVRHRRESPLHFRLMFRDPAQGVRAVALFHEQRELHGVFLADMEFEPSITITAKFQGHTVMSREAVQLLGTRLQAPAYDPFRRHDTAIIVLLEGERLVVYDNATSYALGLSNAGSEKGVEHPNQMTFVSVLFQDGGGISLAYRQAPPPERGRSRGYDRIVAHPDAELPIPPVDRNRDDDYEDYEPRGETPSWQDYD